MATAAAGFCVSLSLAVFLALSPAAVRGGIQSSPISASPISASPAVSPHRTSQNMSSFFPSPIDERPSPISAAPQSPASGSGEFMGKSGSSSAKLNYGFSAFVLSICTFFSFRIVS